MTKDLALIPRLISQSDRMLILNILSIIFGVLILSLLAQIAIPLTWTPVPITGQTFGVALISLMWGKKRGLGIMLIYVFIGFLGLPVFALGRSGFSFGPTSGYLLGMIFSSYVMGAFADRGWTKSFIQTWFIAVLGSFIVFSCGIIVLSFFIPYDNLMTAGLLPFIPGDLIKTFLVSFLTYQSNSLFNEKKSI